LFGYFGHTLGSGSNIKRGNGFFHGSISLSGKILFEIAESLLFCHPVRDRLTLKVLNNLEAKGFLRNDKIKG
jgi:hypothetical protein